VSLLTSSFSCEGLKSQTLATELKSQALATTSVEASQLISQQALEPTVWIYMGTWYHIWKLMSRVYPMMLKAKFVEREVHTWFEIGYAKLHNESHDVVCNEVHHARTRTLVRDTLLQQSSTTRRVKRSKDAFFLAA